MTEPIKFTTKDGFIIREIKIFKDTGHGTDMFDARMEFMDQLVEWIKNL